MTTERSPVTSDIPPSPGAALLQRQAEASERLQCDQEWQRRGDLLRYQEWDMAQTLLSTARTLLRRILLRAPARTSVAEVARLLDLASKLGRVSTGLAEHREQPSDRELAKVEFRLEVETALNKVYGEPLPGEIVDVPAVVTEQSAQLSGPTHNS